MSSEIYKQVDGYSEMLNLENKIGTDGMKGTWMKRTSKLLLQLLAFSVLLAAVPALADEAATNGNFNGSTGWTLATATYDAAETNSADGSGSVQVEELSKNQTTTGTATQAVTMLAGGTINAAADIIAYAQHGSAVAASQSRSLTIQLRYADLSTVEIFTDATLPDGGASPTWTQLTNNTATSFPLSLAQDVDQIIVTLSTRTPNTNGAESRLWADDISITYTPAAAPAANAITSCADCHTYGPTEEASRNAATGAVVGSHAAHSANDCSTCHVIPTATTEPPAGGAGAAGYDHRSGTIQMAASIQGGYYDKIPGGGHTAGDDVFNQTDSPALASCENVVCHNSTTTPVWGGTAACDSCHGLPPTTHAHPEHYAAKNWATGETTNCIKCHRDNTGTHSDVLKSAVDINVGLGASGSSPTITCSSPGALGCHNDKASPAWDTLTPITCSQCHTAGGTDPADPVSGLHDETPTVSSVIHNPSDSNFADCTTCHTVAPLPTGVHYNATLETPSTYAAGVNYSAGSPATCTASCHSEAIYPVPAEAWGRKWHENSDLSDGSECVGCHGTWGAWNSGVTHRTDADPEGTHGTGSYKCKDCHAIQGTGYAFTSTTADWNLNTGETSNHGDNKITINADPAHSFGRNGSGLSGCGPCHSQYDGIDGGLNQHSFETTDWNLDAVDGDLINAGCDSCHGGSGQYWPNGAAYPDRAGRHQKHMEQLAARLGYTLPGSDAEQKAMCVYCHNDPTTGAGEPGHYPAGYTIADEPADVGAFNHIGDGSVDGTGAWIDASETCSLACHNDKPTATSPVDFSWNAAGASTCTMCHSIGGSGAADPNSGLHNLVPTVSGQQHDDNLTACTTCHSMPAMTTTSSHISNSTEVDSTNNTDRGTFAAYDDSVSPGTCFGTLVDGTNNGCHGTTNTGGPVPNGDDGTWARKWSNTISSASNGSTECAGCHGDFTNGWNYSGATAGNVDHGRDWDGADGAEVEAFHSVCATCHVMPDAPYSSTWSSGDHGNGTIDMNSTFGYVEANHNCTSACHAGTPDNDNHNLEDSGWNVTTIAGPAPSCTGCHNGSGGGTNGGKNVSATSPHAQGNGSFNFTGTGVTSCEDCHFLSHGSASTQSDATIPNNPAFFTYTQSNTDGIHISSPWTTSSNEADVCWSCHAKIGGGMTTPLEYDGSGTWYQEGTMSTNDWTTATWTSTNFAYKSAAVHSTHEVGEYTGADGNSDGIYDTPVPASNMTNTDKAANSSGLNCSWCHDVHGIKGFPRKNSAQSYNAVNGTLTVTWNDDAKVFLRGPWYSSPYMEDGAPGNGSGNNTGGFTYAAGSAGAIDGNDAASTGGTWGGSQNWSATASGSGLVGPNHVARIQSASAVDDTNTQTAWPALKWGVHIDENVYGVTGWIGYDPGAGGASPGNTNAALTTNHIDYSTTTNLCMKCHGTLANLTTLWAGHNSVKGGTVAATNDIYTPRMAISQHYMYKNQYSGWSVSGQGNVGYAGDLAKDDSTYGTGSYFNWAVDLSGQAAGSITIGTDAQAQGVGGGGGTTVNAGPRPKQKYHQFTCSKCHTPHASINARLMITNCMNRDGTGSTTFNERESGPGSMLFGGAAATDVKNPINDIVYPEPQNATRDIADPWIGNYGGHERAMHCHNNMEQGSSATYWQSLN